MEIKICGITRVEDAVVSVESGATMIGFIFAKSPRQVDGARVSMILEELTRRDLRSRVKAVGVFVNESPDKIQSIITESRLDLAQIHGDESIEECNAYRFPWYRALRVDEWFNADFFRDTVHQLSCDTILIDAKVEGLYGGSGRRVARHVAHACADAVHIEGKKFFLAGGVTPENVRSIVAELMPDGIDLSSALESSPGIKSHDRIRLLFDSIAAKNS